jgi:TPR repeat protein
VKRTRTYDTATRIATAGGRRRRTRKVYDLLCAAHEKGDPRATYALATWYLFGTRFTKKDWKRANRMLKAAADKGVASAAFDFAVSCEKGAGIRKSAKRAFEYYMNAAMLGDAQSFLEVGRMYYYGLGVSENRDLADVWLAKAERKGVPEVINPRKR